MTALAALSLKAELFRHLACILKPNVPRVVADTVNQLIDPGQDDTTGDITNGKYGGRALLTRNRRSWKLIPICGKRTAGRLAKLAGHSLIGHV